MNTPSPQQLPIEPKPERSVLQKLGIGFEPPKQAEYGADAYPSILRRVASAFLLVIVTVIIGIAIAGVIGAVILVVGFLLEQAISG